MFVIPKADMKIIDPARMDALPPEGRDVGDGDSAYWQRHANDKSVDVVPADQVSAARQSAEKAELKRQDDLAAKKKAEDEVAAKAKSDAEKPAAKAPGQK